MALCVDRVSGFNDVTLGHLIEVGKQDVGEVVNADVARWVGRFGGAEKREPEVGIMDIVSVLSGVDEGDAVSTFAEVNPFLGADFKFCKIPGGVAMGGAFHVAKLDFAGGFRCVDVEGEQDFEEFVGFVPVDPSIKADAGRRAKADALFDCAVAELLGEFNGDANGATFDDFERCALDEVDGGFVRIELGIPRIPEGRAIIEELEEVGESARDDKFERRIILASDAGDVSILVEPDDPFLIFEFTIADFEAAQIIRLTGRKVSWGDNVPGVGRNGEDELFFTEKFHMLNGEGFVTTNDRLDRLVFN